MHNSDKSSITALFANSLVDRAVFVRLFLFIVIQLIFSKHSINIQVAFRLDSGTRVIVMENQENGTMRRQTLICKGVF